MTRPLSPAVKSEVLSATARIELIAELEFDSGAVRLWTGLGDLAFQGNTFLGVGHLGGVSAIEETTEIRATGLSLTLSGVASAFVATALGEHYQGRAARLWLGFFDPDWALLADPVQVFAGRMDTMKVIDSGETATIQVDVEHRLVDLERPNEIRYYTDEDQQAEFPGDKGFEFVEQLQEKVIVWGDKVVGATSGGTAATTPAGGASAPAFPETGKGVGGPSTDVGKGVGGPSPEGTREIIG